MFRTSTLVALAVAALPATAAAQFYPTIAPPNPLYQHPAYRFQFSIGVNVPTVYGSTFVGMTAPATRAPQLFSPNLYSGPAYSYTGPAWRSGFSAGNFTGNQPAAAGYISGGIANDAFAASQREFERAQREASYAAMRKSPQAVKDAIYEQWAYEKLGVFGLPDLAKAGENQPEALAKALGATDEREIASGEPLNHILVAVVAATNKGGKGPSAFLPPQLLSEVRFADGPTADAVNLLRQAGKLPFPPAFDDPKLQGTREALERDFAAVAASLREGKTPEPAKVMKLEFTLRKAQEAATPVIRDLPFEAATASRRFLNRFEKAVPVMKSAAGPTLVNPAWVLEGTSVADLVTHMMKHKLLFAPANEGGEGAYLALHRGLATYLFALSQPKK